MESISNMATAAAKAVWGENSNEEPVSGKVGDVSKGEPYDAGNLEENGVSADAAKPAPTGIPIPTTTASNVTTTGTAESKPTGTVRELDSAKDLPTTATRSEIVVPEVATAPETSARENATSGVPAPETKPNPTMVKDSSLGGQDHSQVQSDTRDPENPNTNPENVKPKENVDDTTPGIDAGDNPVKVEGPGPKPVAEVAREHGGDAGKHDVTAGVDTDAAATNSEAKEEEDGPQTQSHGEGTGEKYVKSSGLHADGGDFDATKPGAGREADRLLEQKGMRTANVTGDGGKQPDTTNDSSESLGSKGSNGSGKEKKSLKDKIKGAFHHKS